MLGDDFYIDYSKPALKQLIDKLELNDGIISSEIRNKEDMVSKGMIIEKDGSVIDLVEKPKIDQVTSKYAISGRYIVPRKIFEYLKGNPCLQKEKLGKGTGILEKFKNRC